MLSVTGVLDDCFSAGFILIDAGVMKKGLRVLGFNDAVDL